MTEWVVYYFSMDWLVIVGAKYLIALPVVILLWCLYALRGRKRREVLLLSVASLPLAYFVGFLLGHLYYNARPFVVGHFTPLIAHAADNGFPSDHTLLAATIAMIGLSISRRLGILLWILAVLIGVSRILAGVHHILDIVASMLIAIAVVSLVRFAFSHLRKI